MRLKQLTNLNTLLLLTVCLALGITLWWSQRAMERPFQLLDQYLELSQRFDEQVARNIRQYLGSGDAVRQQAALQALESLAEALPELPPDLARTLAPSLAELREFSAGDLLAAGKLAGDPQGLLLQAERDLTGNLEQWSAYLDAAAGQPQAGAAWPAPSWWKAPTRPWPATSSANWPTCASRPGGSRPCRCSACSTSNARPATTSPP